MSKTTEYHDSELPAIELFQKLGYQYFDASSKDERESINEIILKDRLLASIKRLNPWISENNIKNAYREITSVPATSLMEANQKIHKLVNNRTLSVKEIIDGREQYKSVSFIDFINPENNDFLVVNQMRFKGKHRISIPDIVIFVNGLPLAVIECKSPNRKNACDNAIGDLRYYQENTEKLFYYNQICAALYRNGGKYGAIGSERVHYQVYKKINTSKLKELLSRDILKQDILIYNLFDKQRLLDIIHNFVIFELREGTTIKKLPRYQQIRATNKVIEKLQQTDKGGVVWHTQGSGKSITMVYVTTKLRREESGFDNPTVIVMTDRIDLDKQIFDTFVSCGLQNVNQIQSIHHLYSFFKNNYGSILTTTIQKFQEIDDEGKIVKSKKVKEQGEWVFKGMDILSDKKNIYVLVDEAHRSHYDFLASFMRHCLPNAKFLAFTGTPINKENKSTLREFYGGAYIDTYTIKQAEEDGATLPILYEAGLPKLYVEKELLDKEFDTEFKDESAEKREKLKKKACNLESRMTKQSRIREITKHIINHYSEIIYPAGYKAMLVCFNRAAAIAYKKAFDTLKEEGIHSFQTRVVMSFQPKKDPQEYYKLATPEDDRKDAIENYKLPFGDEEKREKSGKLKYNNDAIMIVSDMLLTGYDAPIVQAMYLDKPLKEHTLLQAIARVNRTKKGKDYGLIVDYCGITNNLLSALAIFSGDLEAKEVMVDKNEEIPRLKNRHQCLIEFFKSIRFDRKKERRSYIDKAIQLLEPEDKRDEFKETLKKFNTSINILLPHPTAMDFKPDFELYNEIKLQAANMYPEDGDLKITAEENQRLQKLIDAHLKATGVENLLEKPISILDRDKFEKEMDKTLSDKSRELKIRNRLKYTIQVGMEKNPDFYKPLADRLEELVKMMKEKQITQLELFAEYDQLIDTISKKNQEAQNLGFETECEFAVYKTLETVIDSAKSITKNILEAIRGECNIVGWQNKAQIQKDMRRKMKSIIRGKVSPDQVKTLPNTLVDIIRRNS